MKTIKEVDKMKVYSRVMKKDGKLIGLIPTMGYLHDGHVSLLKAARKQVDVVILSIFVNPIQFGQGEDLNKYPRDFSRDEQIAKNTGVDVIFYPSVEDMYPPGYSTYVEVGGLTAKLCGSSRPGHFKGVTTVVAKLFEIVKPDITYFGQKDAQQAIVIEKMVNDLNMDTLIKVMPIVRTPEGLAESSRNAYLKETERKDAFLLYQSLKKAEGMFAGGERGSDNIIKNIRDMISAKDAMRIDYIKIVDRQTLEDVKMIKGEALLALAVFVGQTRLIDNMILGEHSD